MTLSNKFMNIFTGVIALCTLVYAVVSCYQWTALLDSNRINRDALEVNQRARIGIKGASVTLFELNKKAARSRRNQMNPSF